MASSGSPSQRPSLCQPGDILITPTTVGYLIFRAERNPRAEGVLWRSVTTTRSAKDAGRVARGVVGHGNIWLRFEGATDLIKMPIA